MGAWGTGLVEDDIAADWVDELEDAAVIRRAPLVRAALERAADRGQPLDAPEAVEALAAALVVAWAVDRVDVPAEHHALARSLAEAAPGVVPLAVAACDRITSSEDEEWWERWADAGLVDEALAAVRAARDALAG